MEGRSYSEFYRNTSEELFIRTMMEGSSIGMPPPTMEVLGFKNLTQTFRTDSEELFKSWLTNGENNGCHSTGIGHRPRQASRMISSELASLTNLTGGVIQKKPNDEISFPPPTSTSVAADSPNDLTSAGNGIEKGLHATNMFLAKAWFHSSQPMTRSRSSELRRRYIAMQNSQTQIGKEAMHEASANGVNNFKQEPPHSNGYNNISLYENPDQFNAFLSPSNSCSSTFNNPQMGSVDNISSVVSMLKGTLERKKQINQVEKEGIDDTSFGYYSAQEVMYNGSLYQDQIVNVFENQGTYENVSTIGVEENGVLQAIQESLMGPMNQTQQEPCQSESSTAPIVVLNGFDMCDDPCISARAPSFCESSMNQMRNGLSPEDGSRSKEFKERTYDYSKDEQKRKGGLIRYGSVTSVGSVEKGDPTKKRRVERSRKMAEAKEKSSTPAIPSDMQSILKRCENLEKEVRSLKLNLAFMNRKDSEQTKQIEELEKQNQDLADEKERLLEEIERIISETVKM